jgi:hypothetical protein
LKEEPPLSASSSISRKRVWADWRLELASMAASELLSAVSEDRSASDDASLLAQAIRLDKGDEPGAAA